MILALSMTYFIVSIFGRINYKNFYNPLSVFSFLWGIIILISSLEFYGLRVNSYNIYFLFFVSLLSYLMGSVIIRNRYSKNSEVKLSIGEHIYLDINIRMLMILSLISVLVLLSPLWNSMQLIAQGHSLHDIRYFLQGDVFVNSTLQLLTVYLAKPITFLLIPISAIFTYSKRNKSSFLFVTLFLVGANVIIEGGRFILLYLVINYSFAYFIFKRKKKIKLVKRILFGMIILLSLSIIVFITSIRGSDIIGTIYVYLVGGIFHMEHRIMSFDSYSNLTYGFSSLQGFMRPVAMFFEMFNVSGPFENLVNRAEVQTLLVDNPIYIGNNIYFNSFVTYIYFFFIDFGILGVVLGSFAYGAVSMGIYKLFMRKQSLFYFAAYLLVIQSILTSMVRFQFSTIALSMSFIFLLIFKLLGMKASEI